MLNRVNRRVNVINPAALEILLPFLLLLGLYVIYKLI